MSVEIYPADVYREPNKAFPKGFKIDLVRMLGEKVKDKLTRAIRKRKKS